jgi:Fe-S cluster assembly iron-binding protein IscA
MITLDIGAVQAIKAFLTEKGLERPLRIHLQSSGCCDPTLALSLDDIGPTDIIQKEWGLTFVINPETVGLVGDVFIAYVDDSGRKGFLITSTKPLSEWDGFGVSTISP